MAYLGRKGQTAALASADLPTNSITTSHIVANAVTSAKIGVDVIVAEDIANNAITVAEIADDAVTADKLANSINTDIATGVTANTTANAALPKAGGTMTGNIVMGDDIKSTYGADPDLEIFHDGSNSNVRDVGTGQLRLQGSEVRINANATENSIKALANGAVELFHDDVKKFETLATGVSVTGNVGIGGTPAVKLDVWATNNNEIRLTTVDWDNNGSAQTFKARLHFCDNAAIGNGCGIYGQVSSTSYYDHNTLNFYTTGYPNIEVVRMTINSSGLISGDFNDTSDEALKENIQSLESGALLKINSLRPVSFDWINKVKGPTDNPTTTSVGFIAQEVEEIFPSEVIGENYVKEQITEATYYTDNDVLPEGKQVGDIKEEEVITAGNIGKAINTIGIVAHLTKAVQELSAKVTALENA